MKALAILWIAVLGVTPFACLVMVFVGIWSDWRWALTAVLTGLLWTIAFAGTLAALHENVGDKPGADIRSWMSEN